MVDLKKEWDKHKNNRKRRIAIIDIETDNPNPEKAKLKYFGALDVDSGTITMLDYNHKEAINTYIKSCHIIVGFNFKAYDKPILERFGADFEYKVILDLYEALAPRGDNGYGINHKNKLHDINPGLSLKNYKLKTIVEALRLDKEGKGDIDYDIFKKNKWTKKEDDEIRTYLAKDLILTNKLFRWNKSMLEALEPYLDKKTAQNLKYLSSTSGTTTYKIICNQTEKEEKYEDKDKAKKKKRKAPKIEGGHHIHARWEKVRGNIVCKDFTSHYPTIMIMYKLLDDKTVKVIQKLLKERLKAKAKGDKAKSTALKVPINSIYGILGNPTFKVIYNPEAAKKCTQIGRTLLRRYAKTLDVAGFAPLYGFTDSVYAAIPKGLTEEDLENVTEYFQEIEKQKAPNPIKSFGLGVDGKYKFMWFIEKKDNNYLSVTPDNKIKIKGGLFDVNCPKAITQLFEKYIKPKIIRDLDVNFLKEELGKELIKLLKKNPELSAEEYNVKELKTYKSKTSIQAQISESYGPGKHSLIPNTALVGVGRGKGTKKRKPLRYCSFNEFKKNKLSVKDISITRMMRYLKPFHETKEKVKEFE